MLNEYNSLQASNGEKIKKYSPIIINCAILKVGRMTPHVAGNRPTLAAHPNKHLYGRGSVI